MPRPVGGHSIGVCQVVVARIPFLFFFFRYFFLLFLSSFFLSPFFPFFPLFFELVPFSLSFFFSSPLLLLSWAADPIDRLDGLVMSK